MSCQINRTVKKISEVDQQINQPIIVQSDDGL